MSAETVTPVYSAKNETTLPSRLPSWGQPAGDAPIIDAARIPLKAFGDGRSRHGTLAMFVWLRAIRPSLTLAAWLAVGWYAWPYVLGAKSTPEVVELLILYAFIVSFIVIFMLLSGPLRYIQWQREHPSEKGEEASSLFALASYMEVAPTRLSAWQRTKLLIVQHNSKGDIEQAKDSQFNELDEFNETSPPTRIDSMDRR